MLSERDNIISKPARLGRRTFLLASAGALAAAADPEPIVPRRRIVLFNGKNLDGLYTWVRSTKYEDPKQVFSVRDGLLRVSGEEFGGVATRAAYRDYHLIVEWKWGTLTHPPRKEKSRDSGILVHGVGADGAYGGVWLESIECQIMEGCCGDIWLVGGAKHPTITVETRLGPDGQHYWKKGGEPVTKDRGCFAWFNRDPERQDVLGFRGKADVEKPIGEWNRSEVICDGDSMTNLVNGLVVNQGSKATHTQGKIQLQSEGAEIFFRRWELRPLRGK